jgi:hypothetical protein
MSQAVTRESAVRISVLNTSLNGDLAIPQSEDEHGIRARERSGGVHAGQLAASADSDDGALLTGRSRRSAARSTPTLRAS